jgi:hypothetical protein
MNAKMIYEIALGIIGISSLAALGAVLLLLLDVFLL